ncbi:MAG: hypothetical protein Q8J74_08965 [Candidatus Didemnitutus sp.]|nr:hypothetical protein [Candidatus Didemnitutus sp.]
MDKLEKELAQFNRKLLAVPGKYGFKSMNSFIDALRSAGGGKGGASAVSSAKGARKPRVTITPEIKQKLKSLVGAGKTGGQIAKTLGISLPSVQNIKKELGLVKKRG